MQLNTQSYFTGTATIAPTVADVQPNTTPPDLIIVGKVRTLPQQYAYIRGLDADTLSSILESFDRGYFRRAVPAWRKMIKRDGQLMAVTEKRCGKIAECDWEIQAVDDSAEAKRQAEFLSGFVDDIPLLEQHLAHLADAIKWRISGCEILWLPGSGPSKELRVELVDIDAEYWDRSGQDQKLRMFISEGAATSVDLPADKILIHDAGIARMEASSILYLIKHLTLSQWMAFGEKFGMPGLLGNVPAGTDQKSIDACYEMLCNFAQNLAVVVPENYKVTPLDMGQGGGQLTYEKLITWADKEESKVWTGHALNSDSESGSGTLAGEGAAEQQQDLLESDCKRLASSLNTGLLSPAVRFQFGQSLLAKFVFKVKRPQDLERESKIDSALVNQLGLKIPVADMYPKYGYRQPVDGEEVVAGMAASNSGAAVDPTAMTTTPDPTTTASTGQDIQVTQATVLNGAQVTAASAIVQSVVAGTMPRDSGIAQLKIFFNLTESQAEEIMGSAGTGTPTTPNPNPAEPTSAPAQSDKPAAFKTQLVRDRVTALVADALPAGRAAAVAMIEPLSKLIEKAVEEGWSKEKLMAAVAELKLPTDQLEGNLTDMIAAALAEGAGDALNKAGGAA